MNQRVAHLALVFGLAGAVSALSVGCGSDDDTTTTPKGGGGGAAGKGTAGGGGTSGKGGTESKAGTGGGEVSPGGSAGVEDQGGAAGAGGDHGDMAGNGPGGEGGEGGARSGHGPYTPEQIARGTALAGSLALCGSCHTAAASGSAVLGGNSAFAGGLGAPNLTDDPTGIADFSDAEVMNAFRNGIALRKTSTDQVRHLSAVMPYWLFHNMTDADALAVVAYLRSLPPATFTVVVDKTDAAPVTPLSPSSLPDSSLTSASSDYAAAQQGKYLVSGVAQCVKCHSPATGGVPSLDFFSGVPPAPTTANPMPIFAPNITPHDPTGLFGWTVTDFVTALKAGTNKAGRTLCGSMPSGAKGYGAMSDADAHAIGVYLTTIPGVDKAATDPDLQNPCP